MQTQGRSCSYRYDALDRLASRSAEQNAMQCFYCADRLAMQSDGDLHHSYLQAGGSLLAQRDSTVDGVQNTPLATDSANSVLVAGFDPLTQVAYSPYGHRESAALPIGLPGFNGEQPDPLTGHYLLGNGYRAFNPVLMRFNSPDSLSPFKRGGVNAYAYCLGDPINRIDPTGHFSWLSRLMTGLAWTRVRVGNASMRLIAPVTRPLTKLATAFKGGLSGRGAVDAARQMAGSVQFEHVLSQGPVMEKVVGHLFANDILALSATSQNMRVTVDSSLRPINKLLGGATNAAALEGKPALIRLARDISAGRIAGTTPAQMMRAGIDPNKIPHITDALGFANMGEIADRFAWQEAARANQKMLRQRFK